MKKQDAVTYFRSAEEFIEYVSERKSTSDNWASFVALMEKLGHPERQLKCLHVAGTNGKGSTTDYLRSILQSHGYRIGSFTSPHLIVHNDRIRINDQNISDEDLLHHANQLKPYFEEYHLSMFQIDTLISFYYFIDQKVDYVVYEVGMGGRLDSTNVITPLLSIITNIGYDHMAILGNTLEKIAGEKAGIIKEGVPVVTGETKNCCLKVFAETAQRKNALLISIRAPKGTVIDRKVFFQYYGYDISLPTAALYQVKNAALALRCADYLMKRNIIALNRNDIVNGLQSTSWAGRFEPVSSNPTVIVDGAHNEHGVAALIESLRTLKRPLCIVASILADKQFARMLKDLRRECDELVVTTFVNSRAASLDQLEENEDVTAIADWKQALNYACRKYEKGTVVVTGSLYFVSEVRSLYKGESA